MNRDWNRSSVDWSKVEPEPQTSIESQVYIDGGWDALAEYRREQREKVGHVHSTAVAKHEAHR